MSYCPQTIQTKKCKIMQTTMKYWKYAQHLTRLKLLTLNLRGIGIEWLVAFDYLY